MYTQTDRMIGLFSFSKYYRVSTAHRTVEEIWFFMNGRGEMWRKLDNHEEIVPVEPGVSITIPLGTHFQFRSFGYEPLAATENLARHSHILLTMGHEWEPYGAWYESMALLKNEVLPKVA